MAETKRRGGGAKAGKAGDSEVLVLTFPVPREMQSEPPEDDPDDIPTMIPSDIELENALSGDGDDTPTLPPEEFPTEPPPVETSDTNHDRPTKPPAEPTTLVPPKPGPGGATP